MFEENASRRGRLAQRVWRQVERRALDQAMRVPWKRLAESADQYTEWHIFTLWLRAVVDAACTIPEIVETELEIRAPGLVEAARSGLGTASKLAKLPGEILWQNVSQWAEANIFLSAKTENWLDAIHYFSSLSIRSMKAWAHWETIDALWRTASPAAFPSYEKWRSDVECAFKLSNPKGVCQQVLDAMSRVAPRRFNELEAGFFDLTVFCFWMELVLQTYGPNLLILHQEILSRYKRFESPDDLLDPKMSVHALSEWVLSHQLMEAREQQIMAALSYQVKNHPRYHAFRRYAQHCHQAWQRTLPAPLPSFGRWTLVGDQYADYG